MDKFNPKVAKFDIYLITIDQTVKGVGELSPDLQLYCSGSLLPLL